MLKIVSIALSLFCLAIVNQDDQPSSKERQLLVLLTESIVIEDLTLNEETSQKIRQITSPLFENAPSIGKSNQRYIEALAKANMLLSEDQQKRLYGIWLQMVDVSALFDDKVVIETLKLDAKTRSRIATEVAKQKELFATTAEKMKSSLEEGDIEQAKSIFLRFKHKSEQAVFELLSADQKEALTQMRGKLLDLEPMIRMR